jgi:chromosome segregation ATPase
MSTTTDEQVQDPAAVLAELRRAQQDLKDLRTELRSLKDEKDALEKKAESFNEDTWRLRALTAETKAALNSKGIKDADRLIPYIGTDGLDFDDEGKLTGLDERMKKLETDLPEVFNPKVRAGGKGDIFANDVADHRKSSTDIQVERLFNRS